MSHEGPGFKEHVANLTPIPVSGQHSPYPEAPRHAKGTAGCRCSGPHVGFQVRRPSRNRHVQAIFQWDCHRTADQVGGG